MKCTDCLRLDVLDHLRHSKEGFGKCPDDKPGEFKAMSYERECSRFVPMTEKQKEARRDAWILKKNPAPKPKPTEGVEE